MDGVHPNVLSRSPSPRLDPGQHDWQSPEQTQHAQQAGSVIHGMGRIFGQIPGTSTLMNGAHLDELSILAKTSRSLILRSMSTFWIDFD
eukprot:gene22596-biopygen8774